MPKFNAAFWKWFGKSVLRNEDGTPMVLYHGTASEFYAFDLEHPQRKDTGWLGTGVYLTTNPETARAYSLIKPGDGRPTVMNLYARVVNPFFATQRDKSRLSMISARRDKFYGRLAADEWTRELKAKGHDGVILEYTPEQVGKANAGLEVVVFDPRGVKSVDQNDGSWDQDDPDIRSNPNMKTQKALSPYTVEALEYKAEIAVVEAGNKAEEAGSRENWARTARECMEAAKTGTVAALRSLKLAGEELSDYLDTDLPTKEFWAIHDDMCRAGYGEEFDPTVQYWPKKPKTRIVDGIRYLIGS